MLYKYGYHASEFLGCFYLYFFRFLYFGDIFNKIIIPLMLVGHEMIIANFALLAIHHQF